MKKDSYISDHKLEEIRKEYGEKLALYSKVEERLENWYKEYKLVYPDFCVNNYRDSWFHYRKIWMERSYYEVICQMSAFDEHLQRAEKDAVVSFFQTISQRLSFWYHIGEMRIPDDMICDIESIVGSVSASPKTENEITAAKIWAEYPVSRQQEAAFAIVYYAQKYIMGDETLRQKVRDLLYMQKRKVFKTRLGATEIQRISGAGDYMREYTPCYEKLGEILCEDEPELFFLYGITETIKENIDGYHIDRAVERRAG